MKKVMLLVGMVVTLCLSQVNAQTTDKAMSLTLQGGANMSNFIIDDMPHFESGMGVGANVGALLQYDLGKYFSLMPGLSFSMQNSSFETSGVKSDFNYWGVDVPIYALGQLTTDEGHRAYMGVGPWLGLGLSAKNEDVNLYKEGGSNGDAMLKRGELGFAGLIGYEFDFGMLINAEYKLDMLNSLESGNGGMYGQTVSLSIGYRF